MGNVPERMVTMKLPNHERETQCYEQCEELKARLEQLRYVLEDIEVDRDDAGVKNVAEAIRQLKEVQNKLAAIGLK